MAREFHDTLTSWVAEGLISAEQALAIEADGRVAAVTAPAGVAPAPGELVPAQPRGVPRAVEALGYLGSLLAFIAGFLAVHARWPSITATGGAVFAGVAAVVLS